MPRPRRFTNQYGLHTMELRGQSTNRLATIPWDEWNPSVGSYVRQSRIRCFRDVPRKGNYRTATPWGVLAERLFFKPQYKYHSSSYYWYGENSVDTAQIPTYGPYDNIGGFSRSNTEIVVNLDSSIVGAARNAARRSLANQHIDVATAMGEVKETIRTLSDLVIRVGRALRHARRGRWRRALQAVNGGKLGSPRNAADNYLQFVYGLTPHLRDVYGLQQQVKAGLRSEGKLIRATGFQSSSAPWYKAFSSTPSFDSHRGQGQVRGWCKVVIFAHISHEVAAQLNQLGCANPLATAWELVPLSFVVDWFIPIGDFLSALTGPLGTTFANGYEDHVIEASVAVDYCRYGWSTFVKGSTPSYHWQLFVFQRRVLLSNPPTSIYLGWGLTQGVQRSLSSVALLRQRS